MRPLNSSNGTALDALRELQRKHEANHAHFAKLSEAFTRYEKAEVEATRMFFLEYTPEALERLIKARTENVVATQESTNMNRSMSIDDLLGERFRKQNPTYRQVLADACECRLQDARREYKTAFDEAKKRLSVIGLEDEVESSPEVRRAGTEVCHFEAIARHIKDADGREIWSNAHPLLQ